MFLFAYCLPWLIFRTHSTDELFKSAAYLTERYLPTPPHKQKHNEPVMNAPFNVAFNTDMPYFEWLEQPGNELRLKRFGPAMTGTVAWEVPGAIVSGKPKTLQH